MRSAPRFALVLAFAIVLLAVRARAAEPMDPKAVPDPLKPWTAWVLDAKDEALCAQLHEHAELSRCAWPARLDLALDERGGRFSQAWHMDAKRWVTLPGDAKRWPTDVKIDGARAVVVASNGLPSVELPRGDHTVTGAFAWDSLPESLQIPIETGLVSLTLRGAKIESPNRDAHGVVWLQKTVSAQEGDALELVVHRKVTDDIPLTLTTRVELHVAGKNREIVLGKALPASFVPMSLDSPLPARVEPDGRLRVQARPGVFVLQLVARGESAMSALARPAPDGPWREGDEVWVFEAKNDYRVVVVEGAPSIDPAQTTLPDAWKRLPAYTVKVGDTLKLVEKRRGDADPPPNQLALTRSLWLDFDGAGFTASDTVTGTLNRDSRLTMAAPTVLGRVSIGGKDQFITKLADASKTGVEVRQGTLYVQADSRIPGDPSDIPAVSWAHDFHQVSGTLHLPPGYRLLHATGVDEVPGTWVRHWSLLELFLALLVAIAIGRLYGIRWGVVAAIALALTFPEDGAPKWTWLVVLAAEALYRALPTGRVKNVFAGVRVGAAALVAIVALPFLVQHVREGMYPALAHPETTVGSETLAGEFDGDNAKEGGMGTRARAQQDESVSVDLPRAKAPAAPNAPVPVAAPSSSADDLRKSDLKQAIATPPPSGASYTRSFGSSSASSGYKQSNAEVYDPAAIVQTGPGLPRWAWTTLPLRWSGPVTASQRLHLYLLTPGQGLALAIARALLLIVLLVRVLPWAQRLLPKRWGPGPAAAATIAALFLAFAPSAARAELPSKELLDDLEARLTRKPECLPSCASSGRMAIEARGGALRARLEVDAAASTAIPLPGNNAQWSPSEVLLDGKPAKALVRLADGTLWIELAPGPHQIEIQGALPDREAVQIALPLKPHRVEATADGWSFAGIHEDGLADDNLQLTRIRKQGADAGAGLEQSALPPFVRVERTLLVGLDWQVATRIVRVTPPGSAIVLEVPLLPGESVTTADVRVVSGKAQVNLGPQVTEMGWRSTLEQKSPLKLVASKSLSWVEVWRVDVGPVWHASFSGIPFVHTPAQGAQRVPEWRPWPGEEATIELTRPDGVPGQTLTIDQSTLEISPGLRATDVALTLSIRSSRGAQHTITLPEGAELESFTIDGATQPIRQDGRKVTVPVVPAPQTVALTWREPRGIATMFHASAVDLGAPSVNATICIHVPGGRWLLLAGGPRTGPAVLFWSLLFVLVIAALLLGKNTWTPLRAWQWLLLGIGLSQVHIVAGAVVVGWLLALGWRDQRGMRSEVAAAWSFNLRQLALVAWTCVALVILGVSVYQGLLGAPAMQVSGNASTADTLRWFADRSDGVLATPWAVSVPLLVYRGAMLAWALWLALAMLKWIKWGWGAFTRGGMWKKSPPIPRVTYAQAPVQAPVPPQETEKKPEEGPPPT